MTPEPGHSLHHPETTSAEDEEVLVRDDVDAATRFFNAVRDERIDAEEEAASESTGATPLDFSRFRARRIRERLLVLLDSLGAAIERRDLGAVWSVLDDGEACRCFPAAMREEALVIARLPLASFRAPVRLYRYYHFLVQLGDEPLELSRDPAQLTIDLAPPSAQPATTVRELRFPLPRAADDVDTGATDAASDQRGPRDDPHGGGHHRRRSGAR